MPQKPKAIAEGILRGLQEEIKLELQKEMTSLQHSPSHHSMLEGLDIMEYSPRESQLTPKSKQAAQENSLDDQLSKEIRLLEQHSHS